MPDNGRFQPFEDAGNGYITLLAKNVADVVLRWMMVGWPMEEEACRDASVQQTANIANP